MKNKITQAETVYKLVEYLDPALNEIIKETRPEAIEEFLEKGNKQFHEMWDLRGTSRPLWQEKDMHRLYKGSRYFSTRWEAERASQN